MGRCPGQGQGQRRRPQLQEVVPVRTCSFHAPSGVGYPPVADSLFNRAFTTLVSHAEHAMKFMPFLLAVLAALMVNAAGAQVPVTANPDHEAMLRSADPALAKNKR